MRRNVDSSNQEATLRTQQAFTLVELSIVLVILGLLVGGVLTGQTLIRAAEMRSVMTDATKLQTAVYTFRDKYFSLPGDMTNATKYWGTDPNGCPSNTVQTARSGTCDGNGDGAIGNASYGDIAGSNEAFRAIQQLANAGLIEGAYSGVSGTGGGGATDGIPGVNIPRSKISTAGWNIHYRPPTGGYDFFPNTVNVLLIGSEADYTGMADGPVMKTEDAYNVDMKMDDGKPGTGKVTATVSGSCATTLVPSTALYALTNTASNQCGLSFLLN